MKRINLNPSTLFNRLTLRNKFLSLGVLWLVVVALPTILYWCEARKVIHQGVLEQQTLASAQSLLAIVQQSQQHLAQSTNFLADAFMSKKDERKKAEAVEESIADYEDYLNKIHNTKNYTELSQITKSWHEVSQHITEREVSVEQNFQRHAALVNLQLNVLQNMLDSEQLTFDSDPDAHFLIATSLVTLPELTEVLSQIRNAGIDLLVKGNAEFTGRSQLKALVLLSYDKFAKLDAGITRAVVTDKNMHAEILEHYRSTQEQYQKILSLTQDEILSKENFTYKPEEFYRVSTEVIDSYFTYEKFALTQLDNLLLKRTAHLKHHLYLLLLCIFGFTCIAGAFFFRLVRKTFLDVAATTKTN